MTVWLAQLELRKSSATGHEIPWRRESGGVKQSG